MNGITRQLCRWHMLFLLSFFLPIQNSFAIPLIQEVYYDASGSDSPETFTELYGDAGFNLSGWQLIGINGSTGLAYRTVTLINAIIPSDGIFVISTVSANATLSLVSDFSANIDWQNGPDAVQLTDPFGLVIDAIQYGAIPGFNFGEGDSALDTMAGTSLSRRYAGNDTNNNLTDFEVLSTPTPGSVRLPPLSQNLSTDLPTPNSALLMIIALLVISIFKTSSENFPLRTSP
ncbi:MAG: lamin tail domain-containing protein [Motiliproteus sp.]